MLVKTQEFLDHMRRQNKSIRVIEPKLDVNEDMLRGRFAAMTLRKGLSVRFSDVVNLCDLTTESELQPHLSIKLFLEGGVDARIGGKQIPMPHRSADAARWIPSATIFSQKSPENFQRRAMIGDRIRKFNIVIEPDWLESGDVFCDPTATAIKRFTDGHLSLVSWEPSPVVVGLVLQAMNPPSFEPFLHRLYVESRVLGIVAESFRMIAGQRVPSKDAIGPPLKPAERRKLDKAEEFIRVCRGRLPTVEELAAAAGVSVNTLQRLFHIAHRSTVFSYVRTHKLNEARAALESGGLTITQAAFVAGYTSAANFSTAFKRQFGFTPKAARH
ncbi:helix-turn-helix domain-containing protein [Rhizobium sp. CG5]|uniref:helix-turn-helix domain-containing protein n=1 Tax=Rhizobium sp. CG5 TaxID=2726076 RepID=UPI0020339CC9|nr:helix-turn-helix domain-containing protein [Rhizobium sp. CG5]